MKFTIWNCIYNVIIYISYIWFQSLLFKCSIVKNEMHVARLKQKTDTVKRISSNICLVWCVSNRQKMAIGIEHFRTNVCQEKWGHAAMLHVPNIMTLHAEPVPESGKLVSTVNFTWSCITLCHQLRRTAPGPARRALGSSWQHARDTTAIFCCPNSASALLRWPHYMEFVSGQGVLEPWSSFICCYVLLLYSWK